MWKKIVEFFVILFTPLPETEEEKQYKILMKQLNIYKEYRD